MNKINNSYMNEKLFLRKKFFSNWDSVLDCFAWEWHMRKRARDSWNCKYLGIDKKDYWKHNILTWDNMKLLKSMELSSFDIIDLDAYWSPFPQIDILEKKKFHWKVFITFIQTMKGWLHNWMLERIWYRKDMIKKCRSLFAKDSIWKLERYLYEIWIKKIYKVSPESRKHYIYFNM